jgi:hypothetical protein
MEVSGQLQAPAALPRGKSPRYRLDRRLGGPQSRSGSCGLEKNLLPLLGIEPRYTHIYTLLEFLCRYKLSHGIAVDRWPQVEKSLYIRGDQGAFCSPSAVDLNSPVTLSEYYSLPLLRLSCFSLIFPECRQSRYNMVTSDTFQIVTDPPLNYQRKLHFICVLKSIIRHILYKCHTSPLDPCRFLSVCCWFPQYSILIRPIAFTVDCGT